MSKWTVVTNGKTYRLRDSTGRFYTEWQAAVYFAVEVPASFFTYEQALKKAAELEEIDRDNTWVPVDEYK